MKKFKFWFTKSWILNYARSRNDLWNYDEERLLDFVKNYNDTWNIEDCLDEFSMLNYDEELDDYLNNILFNTYDEVVNTIEKRFNEEKWITIDHEYCCELASKFIDNNELYDILY